MTKPIGCGSLCLRLQRSRPFRLRGRAAAASEPLSHRGRTTRKTRGLLEAVHLAPGPVWTLCIFRCLDSTATLVMVLHPLDQAQKLRSWDFHREDRQAVSPDVERDPLQPWALGSPGDRTDLSAGCIPSGSNTGFINRNQKTCLMAAAARCSRRVGHVIGARSQCNGIQFLGSLG